MNHCLLNSTRTRRQLVVLLLVAWSMTLPFSANAGNKKKADTTAAPAAGPRKYPFDPTKLAWPSPPNIARVHWVDYFAGQKIDYTPAANSKPKASWMDRLAGGQSDAEKVNLKTFPFQMIGPYGIAEDTRVTCMWPINVLEPSLSSILKPTIPNSSGTVTKPTSD